MIEVGLTLKLHIFYTSYDFNWRNKKLVNSKFEFWRWTLEIDSSFYLELNGDKLKKKTTEKLNGGGGDRTPQELESSNWLTRVRSH